MQKILSNVGKCSPEYGKVIRELFEIGYHETLTNTDNLEDQEITFSESTKLCCSLGGAGQDVKIGTMLEGIKLSLEGEVEKNSKLDNNNHVFSKVQRFNKLPKYLLVQMVRFFWKEAGNEFNDKAVATKICKSIDYSTTLDVFDFCTPELKKELEKGREAIDINKKKDEEEYKKEYEAYKESLGETNRPETRII